MRDISVKHCLLAVLIVFSLMILAGGAVGVLTLGRANENARDRQEISDQVILANDLYKDMTRTRGALMRAYSVMKESGDAGIRSAALDSAQASIKDADNAVVTFAAAARFAGQDDRLKGELVESSKALGVALRAAFDELQRGETDAYVITNNRDVTPAGGKYSANLERFQNLAQKLSRTSASQAEREYRYVLGMVTAGIAFALALIVAVHFALGRIVLQPLQAASELLDRIAGSDLTPPVPEAGSNELGRLFASMARMRDGLTRTVSNVRSTCELIHGGVREIATGNLDLSSRTERQAASLQETAASMEELTSTVMNNADNAREASELAKTAADIALRGGDVIKRAVQAMGSIDANSQKIADITGMIDSIAFQTNILALNAAVESARAGEQGRGFAVVASEVRMLAQRSAGAARDIKTLIMTSVEDIRVGNEQVTLAGQTMTEIVAAVQRVATIMADITAATDEQSQGIRQVGVAVAEMDHVTQQNAALVEQAAAAAGALEQQAESMAEAVSVFQLGSS
ncbi:methyl-accepting chemotaxis protein [Paraburkholderia sp. Ac-20347]|uniref:methyl-accepting chemotaxis protein n=1 Tax=Paraburkholderia sp. Ac-20347 TaxID=2703892 RepID=UPI00197D4B9C|nr:methyl-accepting chemotaxis protein [Paraburkholderia sp. Ac-20347]MBN3811451.1 HAMP domain-containing protein [Paraburkholderia sp. Ac-20347]